jgi:hypothetical protein
MALEDAVNPLAGASGPGKFAKRTDIQYQADQYGAGVAMQQQMSGAPLASTSDVRGATNTEINQAVQSAASEQPIDSNASAPVTPLYAMSQRPHEPITHGIDVGTGGGSEALRMKSQFAQTKLSDTLAKMLPYDSSGEIGILYQQAVARGM